MSGTGIKRPAAGGRPTGKKILIVDDDAALRDALSEQLQMHEEFMTTLCDTARNALEMVKIDYFDAVLIDAGLRDMDGREACRIMRRTGMKVPIIMMTGADTGADAISGADVGANGYITKPFRLGVLLARLRTQLRQHELVLPQRPP